MRKIAIPAALILVACGTDVAAHLLADAGATLQDAARGLEDSATADAQSEQPAQADAANAPEGPTTYACDHVSSVTGPGGDVSERTYARLPLSERASALWVCDATRNDNACPEGAKCAGELPALECRQAINVQQAGKYLWVPCDGFARVDAYK